MVYHVMIVDDEPIIRLGVKASIPWEGKPYELIGEYANGLEALNAMGTVRVDILITDIKMPVMDGLQLIEQAKAKYPGIKVILLSSYNEFEYARQGLKLGVIDYILKHTLQPSELEAVLERCMQALERERGHVTQIDHIREVEKETRRRRTEMDVKKLFYSARKIEEQVSLPLVFQGGFGVILLVIDNLEDIEQEKGCLYPRIILDEMQEIFYSQIEDGIAFPSGEAELFALIPGSKATDALLSMIRSMEESLRISITAGLSIRENRAELSPEDFLIVRRSLEQRFFGETGRLYHADKPLPPVPTYDGNELLSKLTAALLSTVQLDQVLAQLEQRWKAQVLTPEQIKHEAGEILSTLWVNHPESPNLIDMLGSLKKTETLTQLTNYLRNSIREFYRNRSERRLLEEGSDFIYKAILYINEHYTHDLTLQSVADQVHISKNYFCLMFKKETGQNFIDYVIQLRISRAKMLLLTTQQKIYEIAESSGFHDVKYFSKLFKKLTDCSPVEYRENHKSIPALLEMKE